MGEENKEEGKKEETTKEKKDEDPPEIVLKVDMHCEACTRKVAKALKGFDGVEEVIADGKASKVVVKGKTADPIKVCERLQKKSGKKVELISPLPEPPEEKKEEDEIKEPQPEEKKEEPPPVVTVVLKVRMHCEACAQGIQKRILKIQGVESVETNLGNDHVIVKGVVDPAMLVDYVYKTTKKQAFIVKEEEKEKKEEKEEVTKGDEENKEDDVEDDDTTTDIKRSEYWPYWPSRYYVDYAYAPQIFSDENPNACTVM
ncbi:hypothetical protein Fmac_009339 [Flemingia macrophylla]|uniref:HMA domain-containing protein n=1 Tax=Flemingia macrophylla TaxID=520843 RepID=A0ABD1N017_9FABA